MTKPGSGPTLYTHISHRQVGQTISQAFSFLLQPWPPILCLHLQSQHLHCSFTSLLCKKSTCNHRMVFCTYQKPNEMNVDICYFAQFFRLKSIWLFYVIDLFLSIWDTIKYVT